MIQVAPRDGVLITGGSGFLGHALAEKLLDDGVRRVCIYSRNEFAQAKMRATFNNESRLRFFIGDVRDVDRLERAMDSVADVIHAAALKRIEVGSYNPDEMVKTNVIGSMNVIEAARRSGVERILLVSSDKAYQPISPYGQSKAIAESLFLQANDPRYGPRFSVVGYGNVAGSTGSVIPTWRSDMAAGRPVKITSPFCTRFWMKRGDASQLVLDTLEHMEGGEIAIPDLPAFTLGDLANAMEVYKHDYMVTGLQAHEKMHESMDETRCSAAARKLTVPELVQLLEGVQ